MKGCDCDACIGRGDVDGENVCPYVEEEFNIMKEKERLRLSKASAKAASKVLNIFKNFKDGKYEPKQDKS